MMNLRYLPNIATLKLDSARCVGCGVCTLVCPHQVLALNGKKAFIQDHDACIECGACAKNCAPQALTVRPGVGCAAYIISSWLHGPENASCGCGSGGCC